MIMVRILILDPDENHAGALALALTQRNFAVTMAPLDEAAGAPLDQPLGEFAVIVLDLSLDRPTDWELLDSVSKLVRSEVSRPMVLCLSRVYRGPGTKLAVERRGARLVYEL